MRVAPVGLLGLPVDETFTLGCQTAALTHGHPSGYLAAGVLAATVRGLLDGASLSVALDGATHQLVRWPHHEEVLRSVRAARSLAANTPLTADVVERLGEGWVAEEALAIALFCALGATDLRGGILAAVNHGGDSDSTGAIAGNLLGAALGEEAIPPEWVARLQGRRVVLRMAEDLDRCRLILRGEPADFDRQAYLRC
jgi:ADP-ribosylglycohydrolase